MALHMRAAILLMMMITPTAAQQGLPVDGTTGSVQIQMGVANGHPLVSIESTAGGASLTLGSGITINLRTGAVHIPEGMALDDASQQVWRALEMIGGKQCEK